MTVEHVACCPQPYQATRHLTIQGGTAALSRHLSTPTPTPYQTRSTKHPTISLTHTPPPFSSPVPSQSRKTGLYCRLVPHYVNLTLAMLGMWCDQPTMSTAVPITYTGLGLGYNGFPLFPAMPEYPLVENTTDSTTTEPDTTVPDTNISPSPNGTAGIRANRLYSKSGHAALLKANQVCWLLIAGASAAVLQCFLP
jgi:hypothetical protein